MSQMMRVIFIYNIIQKIEKSSDMDYCNTNKKFKPLYI